MQDKKSYSYLIELEAKYNVQSLFCFFEKVSSLSWTKREYGVGKNARGGQLFWKRFAADFMLLKKKQEVLINGCQHYERSSLLLNNQHG